MAKEILATLTVRAGECINYDLPGNVTMVVCNNGRDLLEIDMYAHLPDPPPVIFGKFKIKPVRPHLAWVRRSSHGI